MFTLPDNYEPLHTSLADKADLILVAPATANIIGKVANGICDDMLTCVILAAKSPVAFAPAMNDRMYNHKSVRENIARLKGIGYKFIGPKEGRLACGYRGMGHISDTDTIVSKVKKMLKR
jgi:phosphopantothenoylcysteine decarboxylase/phosphopantothenate--cysteine ligase